MPNLTKNVSSADNQQETPFNRGILRDYTLNTFRVTSKSLVILLSLLYTDGCVSPHGVSSWRLYFSNKSLVAINLFIDCLVKVFHVPSSRINVKMRDQQIYAATLTSKEIGEYLTQNFGTFRTLRFENGTFPKTHLPVQELIDADFASIFLKVAFSMDGCVKFYPVIAKDGRRWFERCISISCHHPRLRRDYCRLLSSVGVDSINIEKDQVVKIRKKDNLVKYAERIRFIDGLVVTHNSKLWCGVDKNEVLDKMIQSYKNR